METQVIERDQLTTIRRCIYCNSRMSLVPARRVDDTRDHMVFACNDCGWKASVPLA